MYHVGTTTGGWSDMFTFKAMKSGTNWSPSFALVGDMGNVNGQSIPRLQRETQMGFYDAVIHVGMNCRIVLFY